MSALMLFTNRAVSFFICRENVVRQPGFLASPICRTAYSLSEGQVVFYDRLYNGKLENLLTTTKQWYGNSTEWYYLHEKLIPPV